MMRDARGLEVSNCSERGLDAINRFAHALVSLGDPTFVIAAAKAEPGCAMLQGYAAWLFISSTSSVEVRKALPYLEIARRQWANLTERERLFIDGLGFGAAGDFPNAVARFERIGADWPADIVTAKLVEFHCFETGDAPRQLRFMSNVAPSNRDSPHLQAMYGFALELNGRRAEAERVAHRALELEPNSMWAQHCLGHVYSGDFRIDDGIAAMEQFAPSWRGFNQFIRAHNWFHLGALYAANLDYERALDAYRAHVWGFTPDLLVEQTDAILLLWYLELAGKVVPPDFWKALAPYVMPAAFDHVFPFLNAISIYALGRAGESEAAHKAAEQLGLFAQAQTGAARRVWLEVGVPAVRASLAFAEGDWKRAAEMFEPILGEIWRGGGSDEQRGVFSQSYLVSLIRQGTKARASEVLREWIGSRKPIPVEQQWLSRI